MSMRSVTNALMPPSLSARKRLAFVSIAVAACLTMAACSNDNATGTPSVPTNGTPSVPTTGSAAPAEITRPAEWVAPTSQTASASSTYLKGAGAPIVTVLDQLAVVAAGTPSAQTCQTTVSGLDATAGPSAFMQIIAQSPDDVLGELMSDLVATSHDALQACVDGSADATAAFAAMKANIAFIQIRLTELGIGS